MLSLRGLDTALLGRLGVTSASIPGGGDWVAFPYVRNGKVVNHKYRRLDMKDFRQDKGGEQCWWNHDCLHDKELADQPLVVCEGELDAVSAMQCGFTRVLSVPNGAPDRELRQDGAKYGYLADSLAMLHGVRNIVLATDGDRQGVALMNDLAVRLGKGRCRYVTYPDGCKDLNEVLQTRGDVGVVEAVNGARWVKVVGLHLMSELPPVEDPVPHDSGMPGLAEHYRLRRGDFCVVTGVPGSGKSTWVNDLACRLTQEPARWRTCFASFEQHPQVDHKRALVRWSTGATEAELSYRRLIEVHQWMDANFSFVIADEDEDATLEWILDKLAAAVVRYGADLCVIDPWNELDHARPKDMSLTEYVGHSIRQMKKFARTWNVHLIIVAHPTKLARDKDGQLPMPTLYDISDSANWFNKPDVGVIVHRDLDGTKVRVAKSRYHDSIGKPGTVTMRFDTHTNRYEAA
jgi:twinkle protein